MSSGPLIKTYKRFYMDVERELVCMEKRYDTLIIEHYILRNSNTHWRHFSQLARTLFLAPRQLYTPWDIPF